MCNSHWITWQIDEKIKECKTPIEYHGKLLQRPQICPLRTYGNSPLCLTGHQPFGAGALLSLHFFSYHSKRAIGYRWPCAILGWLVKVILGSLGWFRVLQSIWFIVGTLGTFRYFWGISGYLGVFRGIFGRYLLLFLGTFGYFGVPSGTEGYFWVI